MRSRQEEFQILPVLRPTTARLSHPRLSTPSCHNGRMPSRTMPLSSDFVVAVRRAADGFPGPFVIPWPMPGALGGLVSFDTFERWHAFVAGLSLRSGIPLIVAAKYARAQKLMLVGWVDPDLMKAAELVGLSALELALRDRYGSQAEKIYGNMRFGHL